MTEESNALQDLKQTMIETQKAKSWFNSKKDIMVKKAHPTYTTDLGTSPLTSLKRKADMEEELQTLGSAKKKQ